MSARVPLTTGPRLSAAAVLLALAAWHGGAPRGSRRRPSSPRRSCGAPGRGRWPGPGTRVPGPGPTPGRSPGSWLPASASTPSCSPGASGRTLAFGPGPPRRHARARRARQRGRERPPRHALRVPAAARGGRRARGRAPRRREAALRVATTRVVDRSDLWVTADAGDTRLTLVTCYPFFALRPGRPAALRGGRPARGRLERRC